jgi:hypothetical protein
VLPTSKKKKKNVCRAITPNNRKKAEFKAVALELKDKSLVTLRVGSLLLLVLKYESYSNNF